MKKGICLLLCVLILVCAVPVLAAAEGPQITLQPQSPNYPQYGVASYTVKATGTNLQAYWYLDWQGTTWPLSDTTSGIGAWEAYAGETYGPVQEDDNTFTYFFGGIESELDGAYIWCVIEDGHYDVTSQKARVTVSGDYDPPVILSIPSQISVYQGQEAQIRCVAQAPGDTQLSFLWYETQTGKMEDIQAIDRGQETGDYLLCDTGLVGTRFYVCMVETSDGGRAYSSIVSVTVSEKEPEVTTQPTEATTQPTEATTQPTEATTQITEATTAPTQTTAQTAPATEPSEREETTSPTEPEEPDAPQGFRVEWWMLVLIGLASAGAGVAVAVLMTRKKK